MGERRNTKARIEQAALALFVEKGVAATSVRDIAAAVGLSDGALYRHYPSKDELVRQMVPTPPATDSTLVLFDTLVPEWEASEAILPVTKKRNRRLPMRELQEELLSTVTARVRNLQTIFALT